MKKETKLKKNKPSKFPSEYQHKESLEEYLAETILGLMGRMVGGSKSIYSYENPKNLVVFNANIFTKKHGKIWYGDLDITLDHEKLMSLSLELGKPIYILYESDGRFGKENEVDLKKALVIVTSKTIELKEDSEYMYMGKDGIPYRLTDKEIEEKYPPKVHTVDYNKEDFEPIEILDLKKIKIKKNHSPLSDLEKYFIDKYGREKATEIYRNLYVTEQYNDELEKLVKKAVKRAYPVLHPVKVDQSVSMEMLNGPSHFWGTPKWAKGSAYVRKSKV